MAFGDHTMTTGKRASTIMCLMLSGFAWSAAAEEAPAALYGKSVVITWTEGRLQRSDAGQMRNGTSRYDFVIYISSAGRLFSEFDVKSLSSGRSNSAIQGPTGEATVAGVGASKQSIHFEDGQLISENRMRSGARRVLIQFDKDYRSCRATIIYGKEGGAPEYHRAMDGLMYTILSTEVTERTCHIRDGNSFAG
jgi:hypothetical protein